MTIRNTGSPAWHVLLHRARALGATIHTEPRWLTLIGVRSPERTAGRFDDRIHALRFDADGNLWHAEYEATVDPGAYYSEAGNLMNRDGVARLVSPQHIPGMFAPGPHGQSKYRALRQVAPALFDREDDGDHVHGNDPTPKRIHAIIYANLHAASSRPYEVDVAPELVGRWSAACQVIRRTVDFRELMGLVDDHIAAGHPAVFDYTLLGEMT